MPASTDLLKQDLVKANKDDVRISWGVIPNVTIDEYASVGHDCTVVGIDVFAETVPVSTLGTYTLGITVGGTTLLSAATFDLETIAAPATLEALALTAVTANLDLSALDVIKVEAISNNLDLTGAGLFATIKTIAR